MCASTCVWTSEDNIIGESGILPWGFQSGMLTGGFIPWAISLAPESFFKFICFSTSQNGVWDLSSLDGTPLMIELSQWGDTCFLGFSSWELLFYPMASLWCVFVTHCIMVFIWNKKHRPTPVIDPDFQGLRLGWPQNKCGIGENTYITSLTQDCLLHLFSSCCFLLFSFFFASQKIG